jgi:hypothetical protein
MKNLLFFASILLASTVFFGCEKEAMTPTTDSQKYISFDTWEDFMSTLEKLTTDEAFLHDWQRNQSITTLQAFEEQMDTDFEKVTDEISFNVFSKKYDGYFTFEDRTVHSTYKLGYIKYLVNEKGIVKIGNMIQQFLPDDRVITIGDGDETKLEIAKKMIKSDEANHIFIGQITRKKSEDKINISDNCNKISSNGDWKVEGEMVFANWATPIYYYSTFTGVFNIGWNISVEVTSYNDGIFGWYKKKSNLGINGSFTVWIDNVTNTSGLTKTKNDTKTLTDGRSGNLGQLDITNPNSVHPTLNLTPYNISFTLNSGNQSASCTVQ